MQDTQKEVSYLFVPMGQNTVNIEFSSVIFFHVNGSNDRALLLYNQHLWALVHFPV